MKTHSIALLAAATLSLSPVIVMASPVIETCQEVSTSGGAVPTGTYVDSNGRKWVGYGQDGTPPESLSASGQSTTCTTPDHG
ncbi:MAG: hypothetical protein EOP54_19650 [Sphingobacteriales bacterium]|nr:MAG: hypothetical protein EOP54_19650 [Sphingobacteriales bacterium]